MKELGIRWIAENWRWLLIGVTVPLFATDTLFNAPLIVMAVVGLADLARNRFVAFGEHFKLFAVAYLCIWVPIVLSLPGAVQIEKSLGTAVRYLGFPLVSVFAFVTLSHAHARDRLLKFVAWVVWLWAVDALIQAFAGRDILGFPKHEYGSVTGVFYPKLRLGVVSAVFLPVVYEYLRRQSVRVWAVGLWIAPIWVAIILNGRRSAWLLLVVGALCYAIYYVTYHLSQTDRATRLRFAGWAGVLMLGLAGFASQVDSVQQRVAKTLLVLKGDYAHIDAATSSRLPIWETAEAVFQHHPITGVGPRGYRYVVSEYATDAGTMPAKAESTHPHLHLLEIAAETGLIGIVGYTVFVAMICVGIVCAARDESRRAAVPWGIAALLAFFPLNAGHAFYSSFWGGVSWWVLAVAFALLFAGRDARQFRTERT